MSVCPASVRRRTGYRTGQGRDRSLGLGRCERQQGDIACPFDGNGHLPLMLRTVTGNPPGNNLPAFGNEEAKDSGILIIDGQFLVCAESTDFSSKEGSSLTVPSRPIRGSLHRLFFSHFGSSPFPIRRSVAITSIRLRLFPSGVCQRRCFKRPSTKRRWPPCRRSNSNSAG